MNNEPPFTISRKKLFIVGCLFLIVALLIFCATHSLVIFKNSGEATLVNIASSSGETSVDLKRNETKWKILRSGEYSIVAKNKGQESFYSYKIKGFSKKTVTIETIPQQKAVFVGKSNYGCSLLNGSRALFFPCSNYRGTLEIMDGLNVTTFSPIRPNSNLSEDEGSSTGNRAIRSTNKTLLALSLEGKTLSAQQFDPLSPKTPKTKVLSSSFGGTLKDSYFATREDGVFAVFDRSTKTLLVYKNIDDQEPKKIQLGKELGELDESQDVLVGIGSNSAYVVLTKNLDDLDDHTETESTEHKKTLDFKRALYSASLTESNIDTFSLPEALVPSSAVSDGRNRLLIKPQYQESSGMYLFSDNSFTLLDLPSDAISACWANGNLYFNTAEEKIYRYSPDIRGAFLVYESSWGSIIDFNCGSNQVTFGINPDDSDNNAESISRYYLAGEPQEGARIDGVLPFYYTYNSDTYLVEQTKEGIIIRLDYDSGNNGPSPKDMVKKEILKQLQERAPKSKEPAVQFAF